MTQLTDDHLPPPGDDRGDGRKTSAPAPSGQGTVAPSAWGDRILFAAGGLLVGFAAAYLYLERVPRPMPVVPPSASMPGADPHAGIPGFGGGAAAPPGGAFTPMTADPSVRQKVKELQDAVSKAPDDHDLLVRLGNAAFDADEHKVAAEAYERALKVQPKDPNVLTDLGVSYRSLGDGARALAQFDKALAIAPGHWQALFNQAVVVGIDRGEVAKARKILDQIDAQRATHPEIPPLDKLREAIDGASKGKG